jgi:murein DD-endopeptidase MepM/ murein hydrolase activator NlpD
MKGRGTFILSSFALSVALAGMAALVMSSPQDKALKREIARYEAAYSELKADVDLESEVMENLNRRDGAIYSGLFLTEAPSADAITAADLIADSDSLSDNFYLNYSATKSERLMKMASQVDSTFAEIFRLLQQNADSIPPLTLPLKDMSYAQTGASLGEKQNPFHKKTVQHEGLDIVAPRGTLVWCTAPGVVASVENTRTGLGLTVTVRHPGGFLTRYGQLGDTFVETGKKVKLGDALGTVGVMPGFAPHLHYEVLYHGVPRDPVNHIFASVSPEDYARMLYISGSTLQSMD